MLSIKTPYGGIEAKEIENVPVCQGLHIVVQDTSGAETASVLISVDSLTGRMKIDVMGKESTHLFSEYF